MPTIRSPRSSSTPPGRSPPARTLFRSKSTASHWPKSPCSARWSTRSNAARLFGVGFVLEPENDKGPPGSVFDKRLGDEELYRIPGVSVATLSGLGAAWSVPPVMLPVSPSPSPTPTIESWKLVTHASTPTNPSPAADRSSRMARVNRRQTAPPRALQPDDASSKDSSWHTRHRAPLLARDVQRGTRDRRDHGHHACGRTHLRCEDLAPAPSAGVDPLGVSSSVRRVRAPRLASRGAPEQLLLYVLEVAVSKRHIQVRKGGGLDD